MGILDTILQLKRQQGGDTSPIPAALSSAINSTAAGAALPPPSLTAGGSDAPTPQIPAAVTDAIQSQPIAAPQLTPRTGVFDGPTPAPGQPYTPLTTAQKVARVLGLVGNVAGAVAPYVGEAPAQTQQRLEGQKLSMEQAQLQNSMRHQQFEEGLQGAEEARTAQAFPVAQQVERTKLANMRTPEQTAELNDNEVVTTPMGSMFRVNKASGEAQPVTVTGNDGNGSPLQLAPKMPRYEVEHDSQGRPYAVVDKFTMQRYYPGQAMPQDAQQEFNAVAAAHDQGRQEKFADQDRLFAQQDTRQQHMLDAQDARQQRNFAQQMGMLNARTQQQENKPTDQEKSRADLANNLKENADQLEQIIARRPDLFGPMGGRLTAVKNLFGSNDPDIGAINTIKHQLGQVQMSAHGMRSAQGIAAAADSILNNFYAGPEGLKGALNQARNSVSTFQQPTNVQRPTLTGQTPPSSTPPPGATHTAPGSDGHIHWTNSKGEDLGVKQ